MNAAAGASGCRALVPGLAGRLARTRSGSSRLRAKTAPPPERPRAVASAVQRSAGKAMQLALGGSCPAADHLARRSGPVALMPAGSAWGPWATPWRPTRPARSPPRAAARSSASGTARPAGPPSTPRSTAA
ncbi:unnamed protein product, partial [Prorocentrum cordatum]